MNSKTNLILLFFLLCSGSILFGQSGVASDQEGFAGDQSLKVTEGDSWSFFVDEENQIYYIDFETISVNLSDVILKSASGDVLMRENVLDLPVNTIYEIDLSKYGPGAYEIELRSFTGIIRKEVRIK
ncbi:MAG: hypothetical protein KDC43_24810 [Saprospiraceae bacterium]|nr:hypothetical protein [Saprospiraceae bacterium]MCB0627046.1 hypothetical protein [Saprospiraceae bacterium]MCB0678591.1 hypothetical protein [Saprospiraceae bacterium]MCB0680499.1 hypothetical protein [Saprospiraceae bacterium]